MRRAARWLGLTVFVLILGGCNKGGPPAPPPKKAPEVHVALPVMKDIIDYEFFTGRTESYRRVNLQARVAGYLDKVFFTEGALVKEGDLLFRIDQRPYKIEVERAEANLASSKAGLSLAMVQEARNRGLIQSGAGSKEDYDKAQADVQVGRANVLAAEAQLKQARLNLEWTEIRAPYTGYISRWRVDPGNVVETDTILASIGTSEPMYATFDVDERTVLRELLRRGRSAGETGESVRVEIGLVDEPGRYPHPAYLNFVDIGLDSATGSLWMRATFDKPNRIILPGLFSRIRFPLGPEREALCVAEQALIQSQGERSLFVVNSENKIETRGRLVVGRQHGGLREIKSGLKPGDRVVVSGLQRVKNDMEVKPTEIPMPGQDTQPAPDDPGLGGEEPENPKKPEPMKKDDPMPKPIAEKE